MNEPKAVDSEKSLKQSWTGISRLFASVFKFQCNHAWNPNAQAGSNRPMVSSAPHQGV
jgi:hypothetical protein